MNGPPRVLKKGSTGVGSRTSEELLSAAREKAQELVGAAELEAAAIRGRAATEAAQLRQRAEADGLADGLAKAAAALALTAEVRAARLSELEGEVVEVALEIARQVVGRELLGSPDAVVGSAARALRAISGGGGVLMRVAADDLATLREADPSLRRLIEGGTLAIAEDPGLARGEIIVESAGGRVDARIGAQLDAFRRALRAEDP